MPPDPKLRQRAAPPTQAKRQPAKHLASKPTAPAPPDPNVHPRTAISLPLWRSADGRLRMEDRGYQIMVFSDGRPAGQLSENDTVTLIGALALSRFGRKHWPQLEEPARAPAPPAAPAAPAGTAPLTTPTAQTSGEGMGAPSTTGAIDGSQTPGSPTAGNGA